MSKKSLGQVLRNWVARGNRVPAARGSAKLRLEEFETRDVPATTVPAVTASAATAVANAASAFAPQVVADPTNPNTLAMVYATGPVSFGGITNGNGIIVQLSFDGGTTWQVLRNTAPNQPGANETGLKLRDPSISTLITPTQRGYTNASAPTIAFTRSGSIYVAYLEHNLQMTSGALAVERFDVNRTTQAATQFDLDRARDWDSQPATPASERWQRAQGTNQSAVLYQWLDDGVTINRPLNPYIAVDTNLPTYTDPDTGETVTDPFANFSTTTQIPPGGIPAEYRVATAGGGDTVFVAWNTQSTAPTVTAVGPNGFQYSTGVPGGTTFNPNAIMLAVGRLDTQAMIDRANPDAGITAGNPREAAFLFSTPVPVNDGAASPSTLFPSGGHFLQGANVNTGGAAPVITFSPATLREVPDPANPGQVLPAVTPGQMSIVWSTTGSQIAQSSVAFGPAVASASYVVRSNNVPTGTVTNFFGTTQTTAIPDATVPPTTPPPPPNTPDGAQSIEYRLGVDLTPYFPAQGGSFTSIDDLDVTLALTHNRVQDLRIELVAPDGRTITLVNNRVSGIDGNAFNFNGVTPGVTGNDIGVGAGVIRTSTNGGQIGNVAGTNFSQESPRQIHDPGNPAKYIGSFRPEGGSLAQFYSTDPDVVNSLVGDQTWTLRITDVRADRLAQGEPTPERRLEFWSLTFTSLLDNGNDGGRVGVDRFVTGTGTLLDPVPAAPVGVATNRVGTAGFGAAQTFANTAAASPVFGIGAGVSVAVDNTVGSFSRFAGRMYVAYATGGGTNTNIQMAYSDDNGLTWSLANGGRAINDDAPTDNFSEGRRSQFQPTVTVDQATGAVVVMWYDARNDATNSRVATYVAVSTDGGDTFNVSAPVNTQKFAIDAITGARVNLEPVPTNFAGLSSFNPGSAFNFGGPGIRQAVVASGGTIKAFWTGNQNAAGTSILSSTVRTAAGARVIDSDMGAVTEQSLDGTFQNGGTVTIRDEDGFTSFIQYPGNDPVVANRGTTRTQYNNTFAADGTRQLDGFRVVFDRPVYFGTDVGGGDIRPDTTGDGFGIGDVDVRFRGVIGALDTATQGAKIPVVGVYPINGYTVDGFHFATAYFVQFASPQTAVGTYSYAVGPVVLDKVRSRSLASYASPDTPVALLDPGTVTSQLTVPPLVGNPTVQALQVALNIPHTFVGDLRVSLIGPDGTRVLLFQNEGGSNNNIVNMRLTDAAAIATPYPITTPFNNFNGLYRPHQSLGAFTGLGMSGVWTLEVTDTFGIDTGTLASWTLTFLDGAGNPVSVETRGNGMDQDADAKQLEPANDVYSAPGSTAGAPFTGPFDSTTQPLLAPGAHVVRTYAGGTLATVASATGSFGSITVTLDREVDVTTLSVQAIASVTGPSGAVTPVSVFVSPFDVVDGSTKRFTLGYSTASENPPVQTNSAYQVVLNGRAFVTDNTVLNGQAAEVFVRFDRDIDPTSFTPANVLRITGPVGAVSLAGVTVTPVDDARTPLVGAAAARLFRVTFEQPQVVFTPTAPFFSIPIALTAVPSVGPLTLADLTVYGPAGRVTLTGATLVGSGTGYTLTFPTQQPAGRYTIDITPTPSQLRVTLAAANNTTIPINLAAPPTSGALTVNDVVRVTRPNGTTVPLAGATLAPASVGSTTSYTLTLPAAVPAGTYTVDLNPAVLRGVAVVGSGVQLSGPYSVEFGSNPGVSDPGTAAVRAADRPQAVLVKTAAGEAFLDVTFSASNGPVTLLDVVRVVGPAGELTPVAVTQQSANVYRITFGGSLATGQYVVDFDPAPGRNLRVAGSGLAVDNNFNAGLDLVTGRAAAGAAVTPVTFRPPPQNPADPNSTPVPVPFGPGTVTTTVDNNDTPTDPSDDFFAVTPTVVEMPIVVNEDFTITQDALSRVQVSMNITVPNVFTLDVELVPPAATGLGPILLYSGASDAQTRRNPAPQGGANFTNTLLVDRVGDPAFPSILDGTAPFNAGANRGFTPQSPLSVLVNPTTPVSARGIWTLRVTNRGTNTGPTPQNPTAPPRDAGQITNWTLTLPRSQAGTGVGERAADRFQAGFRVHTTDPTNELSRDAWTPVGPASANEGATAGRVTAAVVDPSDPSGNTVYVAGASGGVWKTTNFLTTDIDGPHYVPLTDFGPSTAINIQSLALFPRNNDPSQTIVFAMTGEGNTVGLGGTQLTNPGRTSTGVGLLRSTDGGKTWAVLDSVNNESASTPGTVAKVNAGSRNRLFVGSNGFKVVVDPNPTPEGGVVVYMAVSGSGAQNGVWRSRNGGLQWERVRAGNATDVVLAAGSANTTNPLTGATTATGNLQRLYASFRGEGVFMTDSALSAVNMSLMAGNGSGSLPNVRDVTVSPPSGAPVGVQNTPNPNGAQGRIAIAAPALTNDPLRNFFYKDWLYAVVISPAGALTGLYQTKDAGANWTQVRIPVFQSGPFTGFPSNNETLATYDVFSSGGFGQGNYDVALTVDPVNPAVLYLAGLGTDGALSPVGGSIKLDLTTIKDTQNFTNFNNGDPAPAAGANLQAQTTGGLVARVGAGAGGTGRLVRGFSNATYTTDFLNASRDPANPFTTNSTLRVSNVGAMVNDGSDIKWAPFNDILQVGTLRNPLGPDERFGTTDVHAIFPVLDPVSGKTRFIYGGDQGVFTGVDRGDGQLGDAVGFTRLVTGSRNGNLQLTQFYSGAVQPSQLAADLAGSLFYGMAQDNGFLAADANALATGDANWRGPSGDGAWVEVDPTGSGRMFQYRSPSNFGVDGYTGGLPQEFLREFLPNTDHEFGGGIPRTNGLIQAGDFNPFGGQWPASGGFPFAINPTFPNAMVIQSNLGRVFRSTTGGTSWVEIAAPGVLGGGQPGAQAFGASDPANPSLTNNFIYVGTSAGQVFVTTTGGSAWTPVSAGLDGSPIRRIVPNPAAGSREVYIVTNNGVYYKADGTTAAAWTPITGNLFNVNRAAFGDVTDPVSALPSAGRAINTLAVDWRFRNPVTGAGAAAPAVTPDLYVGGVGGVFKSSDFGQTWRLFPSIAGEGSTADGGYLPSVEVTDLDLSIGDLDPSSGRYEEGGLNLLLASTYGRGSWAIRLSNALPAQTAIRGPAVTAVVNPNPANGPSDRLEVQFSGPVDTNTLRPENFRLERLTAPAGVVPILSVTPSTTAGAVNRYVITFPTQGGAAAQYRLTVGFDASGANLPTITDPAGNRMNQDGDATNGEPVVDQFIQQITLNGVSNQISVVQAPGTLTAGASGFVVLRVLDSNGAPLTSYNGTLQLTSTGPGAFQLFREDGSATSTVSFVNGEARFQIAMTAAGAYPFQATTSAPGVQVNPTGFTVQVVAAGAATAILTPSSTNVTAGSTVTYTVTFQDQFTNPTNYAGTAQIGYAGTATPAPGRPSTVTINTATNANTFAVVTQATGDLLVTVSAPTGGAPLVSNTASVTVNPGPAATVTVAPTNPGPYTAGNAVVFTVRVTDASGNIVTGVNGPVTINLTDPNGAVVPTTPNMVNGVASFVIRFSAAGTYFVTATVPGGLSDTSDALVVVPVPPRPSPTELLTGTFAAATGAGADGSPNVTVFDRTGLEIASVNPFPPGFGGEVDTGSAGFTGGIRVSVADVTGDGVPDYVIGSGPTITATVLIVDGATGLTVRTIRPFGTFDGGVFVNTGDVDGDGVADVVVTPDEGGGPRVTIYRGRTFSTLINFFGIDDPNFRGGARAALGDVNGDGFADLVVSAGFGGGPRVSIYDGAALRTGRRLNVIGDFFMFESTLRNGAYVAVGDVNGDGLADIIGGAGPGGAPRVLILDSATLLSQSFNAALSAPLFNGFVGDTENRGGVRVAAKNLDGDKFADLLVGAGEGGGSRVEAYRGSDFGVVQSFDLLPGFTGGVFVG